MNLDITNDVHWNAIQSVKRLLILGQLEVNGPMTITDFAKALGETHQSIAYHVRILQNAKLLLDTGEQKYTGRRQAALFALSDGAESASLRVDTTSSLALHRVNKLTKMITRFSFESYASNVDALNIAQPNANDALLNCALITVSKKKCDSIGITCKRIFKNY